MDDLESHPFESSRCGVGVTADAAAALATPKMVGTNSSLVGGAEAVVEAVVVAMVEAVVVAV